MPITPNVTVADVLNRGLVAAPDILSSVSDEAVASRADIDDLVRTAISGAVLVNFEPTIVDAIISAGNPLDRATALIAARYAQLGGSSGLLGTTSGAVAACPDGFGYYRHYRNGSIFWHPAAGAHEVHGPIRAKWATLGWERSVLGYPTSDQQPGADPDAVGAFNTFQGGAIHWYPPGFAGLLSGVDVVLTSTLALEAKGVTLSPTVATTLGAKALAAGAALPVGEALGAASTVASAATMRAASPMIAVDAEGLLAERLSDRLTEIGANTAVTLPGDRPTVLGTSAGAFEVHGEIAVHYRALGGSASVLGYPTTDETGTPDGVGRFNHFQAGSIYWTPSTGAHETHGLIRALWASGGWERNSALGYPISDELVPDRRIGHRFPERKKKSVGLPPDVIKLPAEAVSAGFPPIAANTPTGATPNAGTIAAAGGRLSGARLLGATPSAAGLATTASAGTATSSAAVGSSHDVRVARTVDDLSRHVSDVVDIGPVRLLPTPGSTPAAEASRNRFGDFENGVLFWQRGATAARQLQPWSTSADGDSMKRTGAQVVAAFASTLGPALSGLAGATFVGATFIGTTGYSHDGATVHNRAHRVQVQFSAVQSVAGPFGSSVQTPVVVTAELRLESAFDPDRRTVVVFLTSWSYADSSALTANPPLLRQLHPRLDALLYRRIDLMTIPDTDDGRAIALLSAKTLPDGTVAVFIEPKDLTVIAGGLGGLIGHISTDASLTH